MRNTRKVKKSKKYGEDLSDNIKRRILKKYGRGLAENIYKTAREVQSSTPFMNRFEEYMEEELENLEKNYSEKDKNYIVDHMAERFLEEAEPSIAYGLYKHIKSKKANILEKLFPKEKLEENRAYPKEY